MTESPEWGDMNFDNLSSFSNQISTSLQSDSFTVDMERFSHLTAKDVIPNSRITLQRNLSRKGSQRGGDKKNSSGDNERDATLLVPNSSSPRAALPAGASTPEKPIVVTVGATNHPLNQQIHHQITITTPSTTTTTTTESKLRDRKFSFKRTSSSWTIDPRRILFIFATLSSVGTLFLIYFILSMGKISGDDNTID